MSKLIGNNPNQVPTNADLGTLAYQDSDNVVVGNITSNNILYPTSDGTANQVLTTNGSGALSFVTPSGGAWEFISQTTASADTLLDLEPTEFASSDYCMFMLVATNVNLSGTYAMGYRLKVNGSYAASSYEYFTTQAQSNGASYSVASSDNASYVQFVRNADIPTDANLCFTMTIYDPSETASKPMIHVRGMHRTDASRMQGWDSWGMSDIANHDIEGIRFFSTLGNIASGTFDLFGLKAT